MKVTRCYNCGSTITTLEKENTSEYREFFTETGSKCTRCPENTPEEKLLDAIFGITQTC